MNKKEATDFLQKNGWSKADARRAIGHLDFEANPEPHQVLEAALQFSGPELLNRQRSQAAHKGQVTKKQKEILEKDNKIRDLVRQVIALRENPSSEELSRIQGQLRTLENERDKLLDLNEDLGEQNDELTKVNDGLMQDNRRLRNLVDQIRLQVTHEMKSLLSYQDSEIRRAVVRLFQKTVE